MKEEWERSSHMYGYEPKHEMGDFARYVESDCGSDYSLREGPEDDGPSRIFFMSALNKLMLRSTIYNTNTL